MTEAAVSERTRAAYAYEFGRFGKWAEGHKLPALPTTPAVAATYLAHLNRRGASPATLALVRAAIKYFHARLPPRTKGRDLDVATPDVKRLLQGARRKAREAGRQINRARPWLVEDFRTLSDAIDRTKLEDLRDLALIGLGLVAALRGPSELLALDLGEARSGGARGALVLKRDGATIALNVSKTARMGEGEVVRVEEGPALEAVRTWVRAGGIRSGTPIWRAIRKGHVQPDRMHQRTLHNIVQRRAEEMLRSRGILAGEAAIAAREYSTHSLRRGALTSLGHANASLAELMDRGRHKSARIVLGYVEPTHAGARDAEARAVRSLGVPEPPAFA